jgi:hypothetical protein
VPTYDGGAKLERCLKTFCETHLGKLAYEIITVFDAGPDAHGAEEIAKRYGAQFVNLEKNSGCCYANNAGLRAASKSSDCVIVMNDDIWFEEATCADLHNKLIANPKVGIVGVRLLYPDNTVQHAGFDARIVHVGRGLPRNHPLVCGDRPTVAVTSALMGISRGLLDVVHGFDERYRMGYEDVDLCFKARELGWSVQYCGSLWAYHDEGGTRGRVDKLIQNPLWWGWNSTGHNTFFDSWSSSKDMFCHDSFSYLIQASADDDLKLTLDSVSKQMALRDEVIVVGPVSYDFELLVKRYGFKFHYLVCHEDAPDSRFNLGMHQASNSYLLFLNAGATYVDGAVNRMKQGVRSSPLRPILFRTACADGGGVASVSSADVSAEMILVPNCPDLLGIWEHKPIVSSSALSFLSSTLAKWSPISVVTFNTVVV